MCDLEDKILKKNIPGKYSWWDKEEGEEDRMYQNMTEAGDEIDPDAKLTDMQKVQKWEEKEIPKPLQISALNNLHRAKNPNGHAVNTGVKGVLSDYKEAKELKKANYEIDMINKEMMIEAKANGVFLNPGEVSLSAASINALKQADRDAEDVSSSDYKIDQIENDEFLNQYRQSRINQIKHNNAQSFPMYGEITEVSPFEFADAIDTLDPFSFLVVHLYEPSIKECNTLNKHLEKVARLMPYAKFVRLHSAKANFTIDHIALPMIMLYKGGEMVSSVARLLQDELPIDFTVDDIVWYFEEMGAVDPRVIKNGVKGDGNMNMNSSSIGNGGYREEKKRSTGTHGDFIQETTNASNGGSGGWGLEEGFGDGGDDSDDDDMEGFMEGFEDGR